jgi:hypothetical protein
MQVATQSKNSVLPVFLPVAVDAVTLVMVLAWLTTLAQRLAAPSGGNALLLAGLYLAFCMGVYLIRKLHPAAAGDGRWAPPAWFMTQRARGALAALFGLGMMTTIAFQLGFFEALQNTAALSQLEEGSTAAFYVFAPSAWLGFSMLYILLLAFRVTPTVAPGRPRYAPTALAGLLLTNGMLLFAAAQAYTLAAWLNNGLLAGLISIVVLGISFLPPRLIYQSRQPHLPGLLSFGVLLVVTAVLLAQ